MGMVKRRIYPRDITINIGRGEPVPEHPYPGQKWKEVGPQILCTRPISAPHRSYGIIRLLQGLTRQCFPSPIPNVISFHMKAGVEYSSVWEALMATGG